MRSLCLELCMLLHVETFELQLVVVLVDDFLNGFGVFGAELAPLVVSAVRLIISPPNLHDLSKQSTYLVTFFEGGLPNPSKIARIKKAHNGSTDNEHFRNEWRQALR